MGEIIDFHRNDGFDVEYIMDDEGNIEAVTHPLWPFRIQRKGDVIAFADEETESAFGELSADIFNTLLTCWLLIDDPKSLDDATLSNIVVIDGSQGEKNFTQSTDDQGRIVLEISNT